LAPVVLTGAAGSAGAEEENFSIAEVHAIIESPRLGMTPHATMRSARQGIWPELGNGQSRLPEFELNSYASRQDGRDLGLPVKR
jgi:hypothetical protein